MTHVQKSQHNSKVKKKTAVTHRVIEEELKACPKARVLHGTAL